MPKNNNIKSVLVIGSGPITIGQAAEFDYSGTQACKSLKEEGCKVILVNNNPATIMTDIEIADKVYVENPELDVIEKIILKERPDGILGTLGGQTGLNLIIKLKESGILDRYNVKVLGTSVESIKTAESRELFKKKMLEIKEPVAESITVNNVKEALNFVSNVGFPLIIRPAFTLGGTGGGFAYNEKELVDFVESGLSKSMTKEVLIEKSLYGWKEIEFEVIRDKSDNCIIVCDMENIDPVGIHTGDSIVVAPCQTLKKSEIQLLKNSAIKIVKALKIEGGSNIQFALHPYNSEYYVIEVNPRLSRSSALASKASGYPIARIVSKIALGYNLNEIKNPVNEETTAFYEPSLNYTVTKIPRWPFDKFINADKEIGTQMKSTGEIMAIASSFEESLLKAVRSLEIKKYGLRDEKVQQEDDNKLIENLKKPTDKRLFYIAEALRREIDIGKIYEWTFIDPWFLKKIKSIVEMEKKIKDSILDEDVLIKAKKMGFTDKEIAELKGLNEQEVLSLRKTYKIFPSYKLVNTHPQHPKTSAEYLYSTYYDKDDEVSVHNMKKVIVIGSGPIRIGQGVEFDYCTVKALWALKESGIKSIIINNNPETVSTDFDTGDRLYFEPLTLEDVLNIVEKENPIGVMVMFGGQTALNLTEALEKNGVKILGTQYESIDLSEDRKKFSMLLKQLGIKQSQCGYATSYEEAIEIAKDIGFPLLVRPSYVIGGQSIEKVRNFEELFSYVNQALKLSSNRPILIDQYIDGKEVEIDAVSDGENILIPGIMEHVEKAGIHSGDSFAIFPARNLTKEEKDKIVEYSTKISKALHVKGLINIQFIVKDGEVYVLEVNPRASRTVPIISKVTRVPLVKIAVDMALNKTLDEMGYNEVILEDIPYTVVKAPIFSLEKLSNVEVALEAEMKSTGETIGIDLNYYNAVYKALKSAGLNVPTKGKMLISLSKESFKESYSVIKYYETNGYELYGTIGTVEYFKMLGIEIEPLNFERAIDLIKEKFFDVVINIPTKGKEIKNYGFKLRSTCVKYGVTLFTSLETAKIALEASKNLNIEDNSILSLNEYLKILESNKKNSIKATKATN